jgi:hypothetical protein
MDRPDTVPSAISCAVVCSFSSLASVVTSGNVVNEAAGSVASTTGLPYSVAGSIPNGATPAVESV